MSAINVYGLAALTAALWGANFNLAGLVLADLPPHEAATGRFVLAAVIMIVITLQRGEGLTMLRTARHHGMKLGLMGVIGIMGFNVLFFDAMQTTSATNGALVMATNPLMTALLAALILGERVPMRQIAALPVAFAGVAIVILGGGAPGEMTVGIGDLEMLGANLIWALYNVLTRKLTPPGPQFANVTVVMGAGALALSLVSVGSAAPMVLPGLKAGAALLAMAALGSVLAYLFWNMSIARLGAGRTALFLNLVPVFATVIAMLGGDFPTAMQLSGGAVVIAAVIYAMMPQRKAATA